MKVTVYLGGFFKENYKRLGIGSLPYEKFENVTEIHLNFTDLMGPRTNQLISPKTVAIELKDGGNNYRFEDVEEIEIFDVSEKEEG